MSSRARARLTGAVAVAAVAVAAHTGALPAHAETPSVGGEVASVVELSAGEPSAFVRAGGAHGKRVYAAGISVEVTATEAPTRLTIADGEAFAGRRRGHLAQGSAILSAPLWAATSGTYRSLDDSVDPLLERWGEPVSDVAATIHLRQTVRGNVALRNYHKILLLTVTAAGP